MKTKINSYRDLIAWQKAMDLVEKVYHLVHDFPANEIYTLSSQLKRSAISVPSNIAEGGSKKSIKDFIKFLNISYGSLAELETQILIAERVKFISKEKSEMILQYSEEVAKIISGLISSLKLKVESDNTLSTKLSLLNSNN